MKKRNKTLLFTTSLLAVAGLSMPSAFAADGQTSLQSTSQADQMISQYNTLAGSLAGYYASQKGETLKQFVITNPETASALFGVNATALSIAAEGLPEASGKGCVELSKLPADSLSMMPVAADKKVESSALATATNVPALPSPGITTPSSTSATSTTSAPPTVERGVRDTTENAAVEDKCADDANTEKTEGLVPASSALSLNVLGTLGSNSVSTSLDTSKYNSLSEYADALGKDTSVDSQVVKAGAGWAAQMGQLRAGSLTPQALDTSISKQMPSEGLAFGLFMNKSLANLVTDSPDVFAQVQKSGIGSAAANTAWNQSMSKALAGSKEDYSSMLASPCMGAMLNVMASGDAKSAKGMGSCGSCVNSGLYLHTQAASLLNPAMSTTQTNNKDSLISPADWSSMPSWQQDLVKGSSSSLTDQLNSSMKDSGSKGMSSCTNSSTATKGTLTSTLPGVFAGLSK